MTEIHEGLVQKIPAIALYSLPHKQLAEIALDFMEHRGRFSFYPKTAPCDHQQDGY
jgi:hypothetical protein